MFFVRLSAPEGVLFGSTWKSWKKRHWHTGSFWRNTTAYRHARTRARAQETAGMAQNSLRPLTSRSGKRLHSRLFISSDFCIWLKASYPDFRFSPAVSQCHALRGGLFKHWPWPSLVRFLCRRPLRDGLWSAVKCTMASACSASEHAVLAITLFRFRKWFEFLLFARHFMRFCSFSTSSIPPISASLLDYPPTTSSSTPTYSSTPTI